MSSFEKARLAMQFVDLFKKVDLNQAVARQDKQISKMSYSAKENYTKARES